MIRMKKIWILLLYILIQSACGDDICTDLGYDNFNTVYFRLVDLNSGKELTEEVNQYNRDSISLMVNNLNILEIIGFTENIDSEFSIKNRQYDLTLYNDSLYLLYLNYQDTDTIQIQASNVKDRCNGNIVSRINTFVHNGDTLFDRILGIEDYYFIEIKK